MLLQLNGSFTRMFQLGATGLTPTVTISKAGAAFAAPTNTVSEISDGWYKLDLVAADLNTVGQLAYHLSAGTPADFEDEVVSQALGSALDVNVIGWADDPVPVMVGGHPPVTLALCVGNSIDNNAMSAAACQKIFESSALTESYAADGAAATPGQLLYMLWSLLAEMAIAGTTITCKKLDGSTTSMTFTLNSATNPTSRTRAT